MADDDDFEAERTWLENQAIGVFGIPPAQLENGHRESVWDRVRKNGGGMWTAPENIVPPADASEIYGSQTWAAAERQFMAGQRYETTLAPFQQAPPVKVPERWCPLGGPKCPQCPHYPDCAQKLTDHAVAMAMTVAYEPEPAPELTPWRKILVDWVDNGDLSKLTELDQFPVDQMDPTDWLTWDEFAERNALPSLVLQPAPAVADEPALIPPLAAMVALWSWLKAMPRYRRIALVVMVAAFSVTAFAFAMAASRG